MGMAKSSKTAAVQPIAPTPPEQMSYEEAMEEAQAITDQLDRGEIGLEASVAAFRRGMALLQRCRAILDKAEQEVERIAAADEPGDGKEPG
jgi:exodeoxyribonuclease VII small subunit